ncbi:NAD-dependent epimerase/dehydratase family protein [Croceicoccus mobilis]|uniref:Epimerase n=1 Tax=Croceicoccus mobilis TaxID=1703339 RepID=A0A917DTH0_9SPHN|nr:NAD(P)-dependent oxidoreductase [Croceicoccus mobilis]GGD68820.1 epimerase [Croceicoccus mobilis]
MRLALTGATGFVGSTLMDLALAEGHELKALTRRDQPSRANVEWVRGDLSAHDALAELASGCDAVVHVAGVVNAPDRAGFEAGNIAGTQAMVAAARKTNVPRFVHVSSLAAREPQLSDYGWSKAGAEEAAREAEGWVAVRPPAIYGPRDTEMFEIFRAAKAGIVPLPPRGRASLIHAQDLARLLLTLAVAADAPRGVVYEADDNRLNGWSHAEMARLIGDAVGRKVYPLHMPKSVLELAAKGDRLIRGGKAKLTPDRVSYMTHPDWVSRAEMRPPASLWQPQIPSPEGMKQTADWYRAEGWL